MGIRDMFRRSRDRPEERSEEGASGKTDAFYNGDDDVGAYGTFVSKESAMRLSTVYACVNLISETIASLPLSLLKVDKGQKVKADYHPIYNILHNEANSETTSYSFIESMMRSLLLYGNAYALKQYKGGEIVSLIFLKPSSMRVERDQRTKKLTYTYQTEYGQSVIYQKKDILHVVGMTENGILGISPITYQAKTIGVSISTEEFGAKFFENGARPGGVLEHPGTISNAQKLKDSWNSAYKGTKNSHKVAVLEEGMKYKQITVSPNEAQFLDTKKYNAIDIARIFKVPPHMIGELERATFSNIEHQNINFVTHTLTPWLGRLEKAIRKDLLTESEKTLYEINFNVDGLLRGDFETRMQGYATARQNGWLSINDIRRLEDMNPIPAIDGGDDYLVNGNMITAAVVGTSKKKKVSGQDVKYT